MPEQDNSEFDVQEAFRDAKIFEQENLIEDAKKLLRRILRHDPRFVPAKKKLEAILDAELKALLSDYSSLRRPSKEESSITQIDVQSVTDALEQDLGLRDTNLNEDRFHSSEFELFSTREELDHFVETTEKHLVEVDATLRDRLDLGIAFIEMGFLEIAAGQFQAILKSIESTEEFDWESALAAAALLAFVLIQGRKPFEAILVLEPFLMDSGLDHDLRLEFSYLMGRAQEEMGKPQAAMSWYKKVHQLKSNYRDVSERIKRLNVR